MHAGAGAERAKSSDGGVTSAHIAGHCPSGSRHA
jgi:hypothetical protein